MVEFEVVDEYIYNNPVMVDGVSILGYVYFKDTYFRKITFIVEEKNKTMLFSTDYFVLQYDLLSYEQLFSNLFKEDSFYKLDFIAYLYECDHVLPNKKLIIYYINQILKEENTFLYHYSKIINEIRGSKIFNSLHSEFVSDLYIKKFRKIKLNTLLNDNLIKGTL